MCVPSSRSAREIRSSKSNSCVDSSPCLQSFVKYRMTEIPTGRFIIFEGKDNKVSEEIVRSSRFDLVFLHFIQIVWSIYSLLFEITSDICCIHSATLWTNVLIFCLRDRTFLFIHKILRDCKIEITWCKLSLRFPTICCLSISVGVTLGSG